MNITGRIVVPPPFFCPGWTIHLGVDVRKRRRNAVCVVGSAWPSRATASAWKITRCKKPVEFLGRSDSLHLGGQRQRIVPVSNND